MLRSGRSAARAVGIALVALFGRGEIDKACPTCPVEPPVVNPPGSTLWTLGPTYPMDVVGVGPNGVYVAGQILEVTCSDCSPPIMVPTGRYFIAKFGFDGKKEWLEEMRNTHLGQVRDLKADADRVYVCRTPSTSFVDARNEKTGAYLWSTFIGDVGLCTNVAVSGDRVYTETNGSEILELDVSDGSVTGSLSVEDIGGGNRDTTNFDGSVDASSGMVYVGGWTVRNLATGEILPGAERDFFLVAVEKGLPSPRWVRQWSNSLLQFSPRVAVAPEGNAIYISGWSGFPPDVRSTLVAYDLDGNFRWSLTAERAAPPIVVSNGRDAFVATVVGDQPLRRVRPDGSTMWVGSPPTGMFNIALGNGIVYAITDDGLKRYDAATGVMKE